MNKDSTQKKPFNHFMYQYHIFDSVHGKDGSYYPKAFLEKSTYNFLWRKIRIFGSWDIGIS